MSNKKKTHKYFVIIETEFTYTPMDCIFVNVEVQDNNNSSIVKSVKLLEDTGELEAR